MTSREFELSRASELLQTMVDEGLVPKMMALETGYSRQQVYKYINGEATPTPDFLNRLFLYTADLRIVQLIISGRNVVIHVLDKQHVKLQDNEFLREMLTQRADQLKAEKFLVEILLDGKVDKNDLQALRKYNAAFLESINHSFALNAAINDAYQQQHSQAPAEPAEQTPRRTVRNWRKDLQLTQRQLAKKAGVSTSTISLMEQGCAVSPATLEKIARALRCSVKNIKKARRHKNW